ncbi:hypothetical protein [Pontivivens insulae]|uniref:Uncharacterized protein n=1 Tax=Pontivivens insulae TaxID=1639689 RepID=A0A2R8A7W1_9RHOB|nr:hypothetical protein [Pontivivens insulae]RED18429.1 hypothetical protein DFR53_0624 [Pontivivens insulae]SPF28327.1 hypothetical protein POI8812_00625 [Pontivivens insulae]
MEFFRHTASRKLDTAFAELGFREFGLSVRYWQDDPAFAKSLAASDRFDMQDLRHWAVYDLSGCEV